MLKPITSFRVRLLFISFAFSVLAACSAGHADERSFSAENPPLEASSAYQDTYNEQIVQGTVRNISNVKLEEVEAVVEFLSATNRVLDIQIEHLGTLAPNATKEFTAHHPTQYRAVDVTHHRLRFRIGDHHSAVAFKDLNGDQATQTEAGGGIGGSVNYHYADPGGSHPLPPVTSGESHRAEGDAH